MPAYVPRFPPAYNATYVKATSYYSNSYYPWFGVDPSLTLIGTSNYTSWITSTNALPQKFNVDFVNPIVLGRILFDNYHTSGGGTNSGVKTLRIYGTNASTAFDNVDGWDTTDLSLLSEIVVAAHSAVNNQDTQIFTINNTSSYRYVSIIVVDNHDAAAPFYGFRHITFNSVEETLLIRESEDELFTVVYLQPKVAYPKYTENIFFVTNLWDRIIKNNYVSPSERIIITNTFTTVYGKVDALFGAVRRPVYNYDETRIMNYAEGYIEGVVTVSGTVWPNVTVRLYYNVDGMLINTAKSGDDGYFRFNLLEYRKDCYTVVAFKEGYNAIVYDRVVATGTAPIVVVPPDLPDAPLYWSPSQIGSEMWLSMNDISSIIESGGGVAAWNDKSGKNRNAIQTDDAKKPSKTTDGIVFDNSNELLRISAPHATSQSIFIVLKSLDDTFVVFGSGNPSYYGISGMSGNTNYPVSASFGTPTIRRDGTIVNWATRDAVYQGLYNRFSILGLDNVVLSNWSYMDLFFYDAAYLQYSLQGIVREIVVLGNNASAYNRVLMEGYLAWEHNLTSNLPSTHSFKTSRPLNCISVYPPSFTEQYVVSSSTFSANYKPSFATDPTKSLIGGMSDTVFISGNTSLPQKFNIDYGAAFVPRCVYIENIHNNGSLDHNGIKNVSIYGSNSSLAFSNTDGNNTTNLILLTTITVQKHVLLDASDPQFFTFDNIVAYRYIICIITSLYEPQGWFGIRRIEFQKSVGNIVLDTIIDNFSPSLTVTGAGLIVTCTTGSVWGTGQTLKSASTGKYYWEVVINSPQGASRFGIGGSFTDTAPNSLGGVSNSFGYYGYDGSVWYNNIQVYTNASFSSGAIIGVAVNMDTGKVFFSKNGTWFGDPVAGTNPSVTGLFGNLHPAVCLYDATTNVTLVFKQNNFTYEVPSGYLPF